MKPLECRNELAVLARRGRLPNQEQAALAAHLAGCPDCRLSLRAGAAFDGGATLEPDDGMRIARMGIAARRWAEANGAPAKPARPRASRLRVALIAACSCLVAAVASGAVQALTADRRGTDLTAAPSVPPNAERAPARARPVVAAPEVEVARPSEPPAEPESVTARPEARRLPAESAKALFQRATAARRAGDAALARSLYQRLAREFPASSEAALSRLKLGSLLLEAGEPARALAEFERYLAASPGGALTPEALFGRGRALAALGRGAEESKNWSRLLREFPTSPYVAHARRRLGGDGSEPRGEP